MSKKRIHAIFIGFVWVWIQHGGLLEQTPSLFSEAVPPNPSLVTTPFVPTRVTGYGSRRRATIPMEGRKGHLGNITARSNAHYSLYIRAEMDCLWVHCTRQNQTLQIRPTGEVIPVQTATAENITAHDGGWSRVRGLFGVYRIPSGRVWVWISHAKSVYDAPQLPRTAVGSSWWNVYRVTHLHCVHIPETKPVNVTLRRPQVQQQRAEERRQFTLFRKALKEHEWFFCRSSMVPDITLRLQDCFKAYNDSLSLYNSTKREAMNMPNGTEPFSNRTEAELPSNSSVIDKTSNDDDDDDQNRHWWSLLAMNTHTGRPDSRFFWNEAALDPIVQQNRLHQENETFHNPYRLLLQHAIPVTSAFCGVQMNITVGSIQYDQILLSRRSRFRAGTRFTMRGADSSGAVANYAETEQILLMWQPQETRDRCLTAISSFVQTRGSIPLRWSSPTDIKTYRPRVRIGTDPLAQARALRLHMIDQLSRYVSDTSQWKHPGLVFVNLVDKKSDQGRLGKAFDQVLNALLDIYTQKSDAEVPWMKHGCVSHVWYDFHAEVKSGRWDRLKVLLEKLQPVLMDHGYFFAIPTDTKVIVQKYQKGIVRTNCMDCLDRTNVVQSMFGRVMLFQQISSCKAAQIPLAWKTAMRTDPMSLPWIDGETAHRLVWADNADAISRLYAGTPALKGDFTRTGKRTKKGAIDDGMNSLQRYYLNNFIDADRQEGIDLVTGSQDFSFFDDTDTLYNSKERARRRNLLRSFDSDDFGSIYHRRGMNQLDSRSQFAQSNTEHGSGPTKGRPRSRRQLLLRWLPGDLRSQVKSKVLDSIAKERERDEMYDTSLALENVDRRSEAQLPWWVVNDITSDSNESLRSGAIESSGSMHLIKVSAMNNGGYLLGALVTGLQAPFAMALIVVSIAAASVPIQGQNGI